MSDKYRDLLEQYDVKVISTFRSRGTFQCETDQGLALLKEYHSSLRKLAMEYEWKEKLAEAGFSLTDRYFLSREDSLVVYDRYHTPFVLKHYFSGRECDLGNPADVYAACQNLGLMHRISSGIPEISFENPRTESLSHLFERRNQELRTIRRFIGKSHKKKAFELAYMKYFSVFYAEAEHALSTLRALGEDSLAPSSGVRHGAYQHHNILILPGGSVATVGFESICYGPYLVDFYLFLRKAMEKNHYDWRLFERGIAGYSEQRSIDVHDLRFLYLLFLYPEKFWKISNQYYNRRKSWISPKMLEKLEKIPEQNQERKNFLQYFSRYLLK